MNKQLLHKTLSTLALSLLIIVVFSNMAWANEAQGLMNKFAGITDSWWSILQKYARDLFLLTLTLEVVLFGIRMALQQTQLGEIIGQFVMLLLFAGFILIDESQEFKNLFISTSLRNVAGLGNLAGSAKAFDLYVKTRYLQKKNNGKGLFFLTGTPISNTIAEIYTIQRYMQYGELKDKGLHHFDAWASTFGQVVAGWELDSTGVGFKVNNRFARFQNVPELIAMYRSFADVIIKKDLDEKNGGVQFIPGLKGGKPMNEIAPRSAYQSVYMDDIIHRMEHLPKDSRLDNPLKITNNARKAGLDYRLIEPGAEDFENSKVNMCVNNVYDLWARWRDRKGTQLVFCDLSTPKIGRGGLQNQSNAKDDEIDEISMDEILAEHGNFSVYEDIRKKLEAVYANHVRTQHQIEDRVAGLQKVPAETAREIELWQAEINHRNAHTLSDFYFTAEGKTYTDVNDQRILQKFAAKMKEAAISNLNITVGKYRGYEISVETTLLKSIQFVLAGGSGLHTPSNLSFKKDEKISISGFF